MTAVLSLIVVLALVAVGVVAAAFGLYLLLLSIAALSYSDEPARSSPRTRLTVLIPAHDEAAVIARCVRSLRDQEYPHELYEVVVVADNCTDDTAALAEAAGANRVMIRQEPELRGKGRALRWAMDRLLVQEDPADAIAIVDADSIAEPRFLATLVAPLECGARAVQGESLLQTEQEWGGPALRVVSFLLINRVRPTGRAALGLPAASLSGNGMLFARELLIAHPWSAFTSTEDLEQSLTLQLAGVRIAFAPGAILHSPPAPNPRAAAQQQLRWVGGKLHLVKAWVPRLVAQGVRERRPLLLVLAFGLALPPLGLLAAAAIGGTALAALLVGFGVTPGWVLAPWLIALGSIPAAVLVGLKAARAPRWAYIALACAPLLILDRVLRARRLLRFGGGEWVPTERDTRLADER